MSDLLREAEDELRRETIEGTAKKAAPYFIGAIILALLGGVGLQYWRGHQAKTLDNASVSYYAAMDKLQSGDLDGGVKALSEIAAKGPDGFKTLAAIQKAAVLQEQGKAAQALAAFDEAAKIAKDADMRDLAKLRAAYIASNSETKEQMFKRLDEIINAKGSFSLLARELKAATSAAFGDLKGAKAEYQLLQLDPNTPEGLRARASQAIAVIDAGAQPAADLLEVPNENGQAGAPQSAGNNQQIASATPKGVEIGPDGKRIVRLPPGVKLPPGFKVPDDVTIIETPLSAGEKAKIDAAQKQQSDKAKAELQKQIEAERLKAMKEQEEITKQQQKQVDEIAKGEGNKQ